MNLHLDSEPQPRHLLLALRLTSAPAPPMMRRRRVLLLGRRRRRPVRSLAPQRRRPEERPRRRRVQRHAVLLLLRLGYLDHALVCLRLGYRLKAGESVLRCCGDRFILCCLAAGLARGRRGGCCLGLLWLANNTVGFVGSVAGDSVCRLLLLVLYLDEFRIAIPLPPPRPATPLISSTWSP